MAEAPPTKTEKLRLDFQTAIAALPGALQSGAPELLVDYLATVFNPGDEQPAPCVGAGASPQPAEGRHWQELQARIASGAEASSRDEAARLSIQLQAASRRIAREVVHMEASLFSPLHDLGALTVSGCNGAEDIVRCIACQRVMLRKAAAEHRKVCRKRSASKDPAPLSMTTSESLQDLQYGGGEKRRSKHSPDTLPPKLPKALLRPPALSCANGAFGRTAAAPSGLAGGLLYDVPGAALAGSPGLMPLGAPPGGGAGGGWGAALAFPVRRKRSSLPVRTRRSLLPHVGGLEQESPQAGDMDCPQSSAGAGQGQGTAAAAPLPPRTSPRIPDAGGAGVAPSPSPHPPPHLHAHRGGGAGGALAWRGNSAAAGGGGTMQAAGAALEAASSALLPGLGEDMDDDDLLALPLLDELPDPWDLELGQGMMGQGMANGGGLPYLPSPPDGGLLSPGNGYGGVHGGGGGLGQHHGGGGFGGLAQHGGETYHDAGGAAAAAAAAARRGTLRRKLHAPAAAAGGVVDGVPKSRRTASLNVLHHQLPTVSGGPAPPASPGAAMQPQGRGPAPGLMPARALAPGLVPQRGQYQLYAPLPLQ